MSPPQWIVSEMFFLGGVKGGCGLANFVFSVFADDFFDDLL